MSETDFQAQFPYFSLEDMAGIEGDSNISSTRGGFKVGAPRGLF